MKIYRVTYYNHEDGSQGFEWFLGKSEAKKAQKEWNESQDGDRELEELEIAFNKHDVVSFLNAYCVYPDNG
jgi:hypothetical protein